MADSVQRSNTASVTVREAISQMRGVMTTAKASKTAATPTATQPMLTIRERTQMLTQHAAENGAHYRFLGQREVGWYSRDLEGVPFVISSEPIWRTQDGKYGPQEVAQAQVRLFDWEHGRETDSRLVTFSGRYLLNQLRAMTPNETTGSYVFTIARNPHMPLTPQGVYPLMLAVYDPELDRPPQDDAPF